MSEFFAMGGYAAYIWPAYGISALILAVVIAESILTNRKALRDVAALEAGHSVYATKETSS